MRRSHSEAGGRRFKTPKNKSSHRVVPFGALAHDALVRRLAQHAIEGHGSELAFSTTHGTAMLRSNLLRSNLLRRHFLPLLKRAGIDRLRIHDLRHASTSIGLAAGVTPRAMADRLGHATTRSTMAVYAHTLQGMGYAAADAIEGALKKERGP